MAVEFPLVTVTNFGAPLLPTATEAQLKLVGDTVAAARQFVPCNRMSPRGTPVSARSTCVAARPLLLADPRDERRQVREQNAVLGEEWVSIRAPIDC